MCVRRSCPRRERRLDTIDERRRQHVRQTECRGVMSTLVYSNDLEVGDQVLRRVNYECERMWRRGVLPATCSGAVEEQRPAPLGPVEVYGDLAEDVAWLALQAQALTDEVVLFPDLERWMWSVRAGLPSASADRGEWPEWD